MKKQINIVIDEYLKSACETIAKKGGISLTQFIENAMENYLPYFERGIRKREETINKYLTAIEQCDRQWDERLDKTNEIRNN